MPVFEIRDPKKINFTLTHTMPLEDWELLAKQFKRDNANYAEWPASEFTSAIIDMAAQASKEFYPEGEKK